MSLRKPLVLGDNAQLQRLQSPDDLDIPLAERVERLETALAQTIETLMLHGIELPEELMELTK